MPPARSPRTPATPCSVVVAARAPLPGAVKPRLVGNVLTEQDAARLAVAFLADTLGKAAPPCVGATAVVLALAGSDPETVREALPAHTRPSAVVPWEGNHPGERPVPIMAARFGAGAAAAEGAVCVIGDDTPHLPAAFLAEAFGRLAFPGTDVVLGPADDGGCYLLALDARVRDSFQDIPWGAGGRTLDVTRERAASLGLRVDQLPSWYDIDTRNDLAHLARDLGRGVVIAPETASVLAEFYALGPVGTQRDNNGD